MAEPPTPSPNDARWFSEARARIAALAGSPRLGVAASGAVETVPPAESLSRLIDIVAQVTGSAAREVETSKATEEHFAGPEALIAYAGSRHLDAEFINKPVRAFDAEDFPLLMMNEAGAGWLVLGREGMGLRVWNGGTFHLVAPDALAQDYAGTAIRLRRRSVETAGLPQPEREEDPVRAAFHHIRHHQRTSLTHLMLAGAMSNLMLLTLPIYSGLVFDRVIPHAALDTLWAISIGVILALLADLALRWVRLKFQDALAARASASLQAAILRRLVEAKLLFAPRSAGALTIRLREIDALAQILPMLITGFAVDLPFLVLVFGLIWLNGGPVVLAPLGGVVALLVIHHLSHQAGEQAQIKAARLSQAQANRLIEVVEGLETVKACRIERQTLGRFEAQYDEYAYLSHVSRLWHGLAAYANVVIGQMMIVLVMIIGVYEVTSGAMTIGGLSTCTLLVGRIIAPIGQLVALLHRLKQARSTLKALGNEKPEETEAAGDPRGFARVPPRGAIRLDAVSFAYPGRAENQLEKLSCRIEPGEKVAIIGRSGSGKSTLLKLMTRLYDPASGAVLIDDLDARHYPPADLRQALGYLGQNPGLMDETLLTNLAPGDARPEPARIEAISALTGIRDFASRHPEGYAMRVGPRGEALSGGERQAVALARTLIADPKVILLDEPTAAMDTVLEARLAKDLKPHLAGKTLILATHRAPLLDLVDRLIWLDHGRILADGPKDEVLRRLAGAA